jgi:SAM-dependent methyltransferase
MPPQPPIPGDSMSEATIDAASAQRGPGQPEPWQLRLFSKTLKKQQKLALLLEQIGDTRGRRCLLITNGDNNGALNWHFRAHGGQWTWVENEPDHIPEMEALLGEKVLAGSYSRIPVDDAAFDVVVSIDVHEHLEDCTDFNRELLRVARPGGTVVVTTPNGDESKPVVRLKNAVGMTKEKYGHFVVGYQIPEHEKMLREVGLVPVSSGSYSKFFTELIELVLNYVFVMVLARRKKVKAGVGEIAPTSSDQLKSMEKQVRLYSLVYPLLHAASRLDVLDRSVGHAVSVVCRRPA